MDVHKTKELMLLLSQLRIYHMENKINTSDVFPKIFLKKEKDLQQ